MDNIIWPDIVDAQIFKCLAYYVQISISILNDKRSTIEKYPPIEK